MKTAAALLWPIPFKPQSSFPKTSADNILHLLIDTTDSPMKFGSQKQDLPAGTRTQGRNITIKSAALSSSTLILFILSSRSLNVLKPSHTYKVNTLNKLKKNPHYNQKKRQKFKMIVKLQTLKSCTKQCYLYLYCSPTDDNVLDCSSEKINVY